MAVPSSGQLRLYADIGTELGVAQSNVSLGTMSNTAGFTDPDAMSEFYGYSPIPPIYQLDYLVVAGGGGGGGGGGGAGGYIEGNAEVGEVTQTIWATVGAGGAPGLSGNNTVMYGFLNQTAIGGGYGSDYNAGQGGNGGSGGGGAYGYSGRRAPGAGTSGQGFGGGSAINQGGGGGGGAGATGGNAPGAGGIGKQTSITGTPTYFAGGGGGGSTASNTSGGLGGGGGYNTEGQPNTGGGGGGTWWGGNAAGGSGVVIFRVPTVNYTGNVNGATVTIDGDFTVMKFTSSGWYTTK